MPRKRVFLCCECAGTDLSEIDEKSQENRINEHESRRWSNSQSRGSENQFQSFNYSDLSRLVPEIYFWRLADFTLEVSEYYKYGPCDSYYTKI